MERTRQIPIWFFIGALLLAYGLLICGAGVYYVFRPPVHQVALAGLHADVWWGALLIGLGAVYCIKYWPRRADRRP
jgi:hypothetical protein